MIQSDPITCTRHFDYQVNYFLKHFLLSNAEPLRQISDWFCRVEHTNKEVHLTVICWYGLKLHLNLVKMGIT